MMQQLECCVADRSATFMPIEFAPGLWRGRKPTLDDWEVLEGIGIRFVIDLQQRTQNGPMGLIAGAEIYAVPMSSFIPPPSVAVGECIRLLCGLGPIYIHCRAGVDRAGFVVARYRMQVQGWTKQRAAAEMVAMGNHHWLRWWTWFL
jgi:hypothetical protein